MGEHVMTLLYKYFPLSPSEEIHKARLLSAIDGWLYFASPISFNDPFEMQPPLLPPTRLEVREAIKALNSHSADFISRPVLKNIHSQITKRFNASEARTISTEWLKKVGVLCLTTDPKNLLMWAHYASNHTGICLGFDNGCVPFKSAQPVAYSDIRSKIPVLGEVCDEALMKSVLYSKSSHWRYEDEWRCVKRPISQDEMQYHKSKLVEDPLLTESIADLLASEGGAGCYQFDTSAIRRVYFGARIEADVRDQIFSVVSEKLSAKSFQLSIDESKYQLNERRHVCSS